MMRIVPAGARARADAARSSGHVIPEPWLDILDRAVMHRGPDGAGRFRDRSVRPDGTLVDVALVHRRLAILDRAGGHQPMVGGPSPEGHSSFTGPDAGRQGPGGAPPCPVCGPGRRAVVFNGCIYNHRELRAELQAAGHRFATDHSDTEVLLHGWAHWRRGLWRRLEGMFAVGMWDAAAGGAVLARDQFGEKPLYLWTVDRDGVRWHVWASVPPELTALRPALGGGAAEAPRPGAASLLEWVRFGFAPAAPTMVGTAVAPGQAITYLPGTPGHDPAPCDDLGAPEPPGSALFGVLSPDGPLAHRRTAPLDAGAVEVALRGAVRLRLEADVPVGCFLSGGVDSALVAFLAGEAAGGPSTFTVRMPDPELDESEAAGEAARAIGSRHHTLDCGASP
ncbi:MAG TPA: asparagine synthase-related protein, partial [Phycisphaerales bacterium]|nr:asparagine synthase-related protein [Phycisphaerales bacterium]